MTEIGTGMQDEHAPRHTEHGGPATYEPDADEKKAIKLVEDMFDRARKHRAQYDEKWLDYYRMFRGKQWKEQRPSYRHSEVVNLVFRTIQSLVPIQVDHRPRFEFLPQEPGDLELSEILNEMSEADWQKKGWSEQELEVVYDANFYGTGLSKVVVKEEMGRPEIVYESADPFYCFPDPDARDVNKDCGFFVYAEPMDIRKVKKLYPDKAQWLKADIMDLMKGSKTDLAPLKFRSAADNKVMAEGGTPDPSQKDKALLITAWIAPDFLTDDYEEVEKKGIDDVTGAERVEGYEQRAKYPNGRKIVTCNGVLLEDNKDGMGYDDNEIPFQRYVNYLLPREFWGISEVEQLEGPQKIFNKLVSFALDVLTLMGNPIWKVHGASGVDPESLVNRPGLIVEWDGDPAHEPKREEGVSLQPYVLQMVDRMGEWFDSIAGSNDVTRGVQPTGVTAASAINSLQEASHTRVRQKQRNLDVYLQHVGRQWLSRVLQFRTAPEVYRLTGVEGAQKYFKAHVEEYDQVDPQTQRPTGEKGRKLIVQPYNSEGQMDLDQRQAYEVRGKFDVKVSTGSSLPFAKAEKEEKLLNLFQAGIIDEEEVLRGVEFPNWEAVLQRMQQKKMQEAQAQQQPPAGPPPAA